MTSRSVFVRVPATVGNFGGALNCAALALNAPFNVRVTTRQDGHVGIRYFGENGERVPRDSSNLVVRAMKAALEYKGLQFSGADFEIYSSVPVGVGLGSSTAAVLAGLIAADRLFRLGLGEKTLFELAGTYEDRSDNLRAAWSGGFVGRFEQRGSFAYGGTAVPEDFALSVVIPEIRKIPNPGQRPSLGQESLYFRRARALAQFLAQPWDRPAPDLGNSSPEVGEKTVPGLEEAVRVRTPGLIALFVCGSGPAVGILAPGEFSAAAVMAVSDCFAWHGVAAKAVDFRPSNAGAREWNQSGVEVPVPATVGVDVPLQKPAPLPA